MMKTQRKSDSQLRVYAHVVCLLTVFTLTVFISHHPSTSASLNSPQVQASPKIRAKSYLKMTEEEQKESIGEKGDSVVYALGNSGGMSIKDKITPDAVAAIKPFVDAYAKRRGVANNRSGCDFGREPLSSVLGRWWRNQAVIMRAWDAERGIGKTRSN